MAGDNSDVARAVFKVQLSLVDGAAVNSPELLYAGGVLLSSDDYADVVSERTFAHFCGLPTCPNPLPVVRPGDRCPRYRISLREHRVYDLEESRLFCSPDCLISSRAFAKDLPKSRPFDLPPFKVKQLLALFSAVAQSPGDDPKGKQEHRLSLEENHKLEIKEKDAALAEVSIHEWIGQADAVEGYVSQRQRDGSSCGKVQKVMPAKGTLLETAPSLSDAMSMSSVMYGNEEDELLKFSTQACKVSEMVLNKLEGAVLAEKKNATSKRSSKSSSKKPKQKPTGCKFQEFDFTSAIIDEGPSSIKGPMSNHVNVMQCDYSFATATNDADTKCLEVHLVENDHIECFVEEFDRALDLSKNKEDGKKKEPVLRSSLKNVNSKNRRHSVRWADKLSTSTNEEKCITQRDLHSQIYHEDSEVDNSLRLASAEACVAAIAQASEAVSLGKSEAEDAVSQAGIIIVAQPHDTDIHEEEIFEFDRGIVKWPRKPALLDTDMFNVEDSWHDTPPEGFSLDLSPFATMWMTLFQWITCSTLAYVYGRDENSKDEFSLVNGREYPHKIKDGQSAEIRKVLDGCISRALPAIIGDLKLPISVSTIEKTLAYLLNTMSFVEALPSFKTKQWQLVALLFLDSLSVHHLPALAPIMASGSMLQHKVLMAAQISIEEYDSMIDLLLPLGRMSNGISYKS